MKIHWLTCCLLLLCLPAHSDELHEGDCCGLSQAAPAPSGDDRERRFAPDRLADFTHIRIDITPNYKARTIVATTRLEFTPIAKNLIELKLNAIDFNIKSITASHKIKDHQNTGEHIIIVFEEEGIPAGTKSWVEIAYGASPEYGLFFRTPEMGYPAEDIHIWTQGQTHSAPYWFPCHDYPNEKASTEIHCTVPSDYVVVANGKQTGSKDAGNGLKTVSYLQKKPHVSYLVCLIAGNFKKLSKKHGDLTVDFYTPPSLIEHAENSFRDTLDCMQFFEKEIGITYPWAKYDQAVVHDFTSGGMENTTLTLLTSNTLNEPLTENIRTSRGLVAHELAHQWFGDYTTCKDWSHIWLNEGFATYYEKLHDRHMNGERAYLNSLYRSAGQITRKGPDTPIVWRLYDRAWEQFNGLRAYQKGAWVLHMLRTQLGEDLYRKCIKTFLQRHGLKSVVTEDLNKIVEELSGRSFDRFFDQWVYHGGTPKLAASYKWDGKTSLATVTIKQTQKTSDIVRLFELSTKIRFIINDKPVDFDITLKNRSHDFTFELPSQPTGVILDPELAILAGIKFTKPKQMLYAQARDSSNLVGQFRALETLRSRDPRTLKVLRQTLATDPFWAVRSKAADALGAIQSPETFKVLVELYPDQEARVRQAVVRNIAKFAGDEAFAALEHIIKRDNNPYILSEALSQLGKYGNDDVKGILLDHLEKKSFKDLTAKGALNGLNLLGDVDVIEDLMDVLEDKYKDFSQLAGFSHGLTVLGTLARDAEPEDKDDVYRFISELVTHPKMSIRTDAMKALGNLGDKRAIPLLKPHTESVDRRFKKAAEAAIKKIEQNEPPSEAIKNLRKQLNKLLKANAALEAKLKKLEEHMTAKKPEEKK